MPNPSHDNFIFLLCEHPDLAVSLACRAGARLSDPGEGGEATGGPLTFEARGHVDVRVGVGLALPADVVVTGRLPSGRTPWALVFEIPLRRDPDKRWSLPYLRTGLQYLLRCPAWVIVLSPDTEVRRSFAGMFEDGFDDDPMRPLFVDPSMLWPIRSLDEAIANPARAVLAAILHADDPEDADAVHVARTALLAVRRSSLREPERYVQLLTDAIGADTMNRITVELGDDDREPLSEWERRGASFVRGKQEGCDQARAAWLAGLRATVQRILAARGMDATPDDRAWIDACTSVDELQDAVIRAATMATRDGFPPRPQTGPERS